MLNVDSRINSLAVLVIKVILSFREDYKIDGFGKFCEFNFSSSFHHRCSFSHQKNLFLCNFNIDIIVGKNITGSVDIIANLPFLSLPLGSSSCNLLRVASESSYVPSKPVSGHQFCIRKLEKVIFKLASLQQAIVSGLQKSWP